MYRVTPRERIDIDSDVNVRMSDCIPCETPASSPDAVYWRRRSVGVGNDSVREGRARCDVIRLEKSRWQP